MKPTKKTYAPITESAHEVSETMAVAETIVPDPPEPLSEPTPVPEPIKTEVAQSETLEQVIAPVALAVPVYAVEPALEEDHFWIAALWERYVDLLGAGFEGIWTAYLQDREAGAGTHYIDVCRPARGFHVYTKQSGGHLLRRAIAVVNPRQGVGRALLAPLKGKVFRFVVQSDNTAAIAFHNALGCASTTQLVDASTGKLCTQYFGVFPRTPKAVAPAVPEAPGPVIGEWRKG